MKIMKIFITESFTVFFVVLRSGITQKLNGDQRFLRSIIWLKQSKP